MSSDTEVVEEKTTRTEEIELESHQIATKTTTPLHTTDWYIKWVSSVILMIGMILAANNLFPWNIIVQAIGIAGWLIVSVMWNDRALMIVNAVGVAILLNGLVAYVLEG
tara:strand:+ start:275 stop:601 length:327 start_codon:yes stop_codon:yes gene_type:complete